MSVLKRCKLRCNPRFRVADGADHTGIDLFVRCMTCDRRGPHVECVRSTPELKAIVAQAWNEDLSA